MLYTFKVTKDILKAAHTARIENKGKTGWCAIALALKVKFPHSSMGYSTGEVGGGLNFRSTKEMREYIDQFDNCDTEKIEELPEFEFTVDINPI